MGSRAFTAGYKSSCAASKRRVLAYFRATGKGWHTRMDAALKEWITAQD